MKQEYATNYNFKGQNAIGLIPWDVDFLEEIEKLSRLLSKAHTERYAPSDKGCLTDSVSDKHNVVLVFPHGRPRRYLEDRYKKMAKEVGKAFILPQIITGSDFLSLCLAHFERGKNPYRELASLDRIAILHEAVLQVASGLPKSSVLRRLVEISDAEKAEAVAEKMGAVKNFAEQKKANGDKIKQGNSCSDNARYSDFHEKSSTSHELDVKEKSLSLAKFFPWAHSLDALFEECFVQLVDIIDITHTEGEVSAFAGALLSTLRAIHRKYLSLLSDPTGSVCSASIDGRASTPSFSAYRAAKFIQAYYAHQKGDHSSENEDNQVDFLGLNTLSPQEKNEFFADFMPEVFRDKIIIFAGFVRLTEAEEMLYRYFWENGAAVVWHSDPALVCEDYRALSNVHHACIDHKEWLETWQIPCELLCSSRKQEPRIHFFAAYDAHSQVQALKADLVECIKEFEPCLENNTADNFLPTALDNNKHGDIDNALAENTMAVDANILAQEGQHKSLYSQIADDSLALILPKPGLLMPVLHELPEKDINISMGYPVERTLLGQFIGLLINLQQNKQEKKHTLLRTQGAPSNQPEYVYVWKDIVALLRHPYARMIVPYDADLDSTEQNNLHKPFEEENTENQIQDYAGVAHNSFEEQNGENQRAQWRNLLYYLEKSLRSGNALVSVSDFLDEVLGDYDNAPITLSEELDSFISEFFEHTVFAFERVESLHTIADVLLCLADFLLKHGSTLWQRFPLDAEALVRLVQNIVPALKENALAHDYLPQDALFMVLDRLFSGERIPFEADPLTGMQILGMLESRLLRFRKVFIMDMTEDNLPGITTQDPLMPDSLRNLLGLPDTHKREVLAAHTFYRLMAGAEDVWLYWQEGIQSSEVQSRKSFRSRFVEECLWKLEQEKKTLLDEDESIVRGADCRPHTPTRQQKKQIVCTDEIRMRLRSFLECPLSASALNTYIQCPARFFYTYLGGLGEIEEVSEGDNYGEFGTWIHQVLQDAYKEFLGKECVHDAENLEKLLKLFDERLQSDNVLKFLSPESKLMLARTGRHHLMNYWKSMPQRIKLLGLEAPYECVVPSVLIEGNPLGLERLRLRGTFDRVDMRIPKEVLAELEKKEQLTEGDEDFWDEDDETTDFDFENKGEHWILDYKTGKGQKVNKLFWTNTPLWEAIKNANQNREQNQHDEILQEIALRMPNIQLPFYLYVYAQNFPQVKCNAAWVFLGEAKKEVALLEIVLPKAEKSSTKGKVTKKTKTIAEVLADDTKKTEKTDKEQEKDSWELLSDIKNIFMPELLAFSLGHLLHTQSFMAVEGKSCTFCPHREYC